MQLRRILALYLSLILSAPSFAQQSGVSVQQDSAAQQNLGRVVQSPEARSPNLPTRNTLQSQPTLILPDMGDPGGDALSPLDERKIGEQIMREIRRDRDFSNDWPIYDYLNQMERRLMQAAKRLQLGGANAQGSAAYDYEVFAIKDPSINAFALPGGFIGFHTGLLITAETDSEVASVMGHEIGHVLQRHIARSLERQGTNSIIALAGIVCDESIRVAGDQFTADVLEYVRRQHNMLVGERTAEMIKINIGSALTTLDDPPPPMMVSGRDLMTGIPREISLTYSEIATALDKSISKVEGAILKALEITPPELASDIHETGIYLTGGGALIRGLDKRISAKTKLKVIVAEDPLRAVVRGTGIALKNIHRFQFLMT